MVQLNGSEGEPIGVSVGDQHDPGDIAAGTSIFRGFDLGPGAPGQARLNRARAEAHRLSGEPYTYKKNSGMFNRGTLNCAEFAEKVMRAAGLNVSAGFFISSPLELTTGRSVVKRAAIAAFHGCIPGAGGQPWYQRFQR